MKIAKFILRTAFGALFAVAATIIGFIITAHATDNWNKVSTPLFWVATTYYALYALVTGGTLGLVVIGLKLDTLTGAAFGLIINVFSGFIVFYLMGGNWQKEIYYIFYAFLLAGAVNGAIVSLINLWKEPLK